MYVRSSVYKESISICTIYVVKDKSDGKKYVDSPFIIDNTGIV